MTLQISFGGAPVQDAVEEASNLTRLGYPPPADFARANALLLNVRSLTVAARKFCLSRDR